MTRSFGRMRRNIRGRKRETALATERPKLDNARMLKGIDYVSPDVMELKDTMKNARKSWMCKWSLQCRVNRVIPQGGYPQRRLRTRPRQIATTTSKEKPTALPAQRKDEQYTHALLKPTNPRGSALMRLNAKIMKITWLRGGFNALSHHNLVQKLLPILYAMKIPDGNAAVDKGWGKLKDLPAWRETKVKSTQRGHRAGTRRRQNSSFCDAHGLVPLNSELEPKFSNNTMAASYYEETL